MTPESFTVRVRRAADWQVVELMGELDMATAPVLTSWLEGLVGSRGPTWDELWKLLVWPTG